MIWTLQLIVLLNIVAVRATVTTTQQQFTAGKQIRPATFGLHDNYDAGLFTPLEDLAVLSTDSYAHMTHPAFPRHGVRMKKSKFCDGTVNSYTGYIDIEARHLFFYFFESRSDPDKDDVIFWTNGGPGCSSSMGLFMELGTEFRADPMPLDVDWDLRVLDENGPKFHPESWNSNANIFFIDQPIGVGFSYAEHGESVSTSKEAAQDIAAFVAIFFEHFHKFKGRAFHMAGESYGGQYIPLFAAAVYDQNARMVSAGMTPINLTSVMIGNGVINYTSMVISYYDIACTSASSRPSLDIRQNEEPNPPICGAAVKTCANEFVVPYEQSGLSPYDITRRCEGTVRENLCYPEVKHIANYLDRPSVRSQLGVDSSFSGKNFSSCNWNVNQAFKNALDEHHETQHYISALLERGVKVLIYAGTYDWICNWVGNERWTLDLEWNGQEEFVRQELRVWVVDGKRAGRVRNAGPFTFVTIEGAGHMVPYDKPVQALEMVKRWLAGEDL
ncbi:hypothetical protein AMATHDRAFT_7364 [Amanita thiersii Skay4041]|uniref:Carboxypeptidase n=1 Tax=Amanita thiersii Skay4041 TaxID=703135 RepID=A0A2A9NGQ0_9AGAR|nr:hypothetical protein AMATHDRAFT_7364 [Amanita thiersii Skay4041]